MAPTVPAGEPSALAAGTKWTWTQSWSDFPAADGWAVTYHATGPSSFTISTSVSGTDFLASKASADTGPVLPGVYAWEARAVLSGESYVASSGTWTVTAKPATTEGKDGRAHAALMLAKVEAELEARVLGDGSAHESYGNGDQSITKLTIADLNKLRVFYQLEVQRHANGGTLPTYEVAFVRA